MAKKKSEDLINLQAANSKKILYSGKGSFKDVLLEAISKDVNLEGLDASGQNLAALDITDAVALRSTPLSFKGGKFNKAELAKAVFYGADLSNTSFLSAKGRDMTICNCKMDEVIFSSLNAPGLHIKGGELKNSFFINSNLQGAKFDINYMSGIFLTADLEGATFNPKAKLFEVDFGMSTINKVDFSRVLFERSNLGTSPVEVVGTKFTGAEFKETRVVFSEYKKCDFSYTRWIDGSEADTIRLKDCKLDFAFMDKLNAERFHLVNTSMENADIHAKWRSSRFINSDISSTKFNDSALLNAEFLNVIANRTNFGSAEMSGTEIEKCNWLLAKMGNVSGRKVSISDSSLPENSLEINKELNPKFDISKSAELNSGLKKNVSISIEDDLDL